jgi:putative ABC transport system permease protein
MIPVRYNVRSLAVRRTTTIATALGVALVVWVLASALMLSAGIKKTLGSTGARDVAIVLRVGAESELESQIDEPSVGMLLNGPGRRPGPDRAVVTSETVVVAAMQKVGGEGLSNVTIRGVRDGWKDFHPEIRIVTGRPTQGPNEALIGTKVRGRFKGLDLEQSFDLRKNFPVKVVGVFEADGSSYESEVWADIDAVRTSFGDRQGLVSSVRVKLSSADAFDGFKATAEHDKRLGFKVLRETEYYEKQSQGTAIFFTAMGTVVAVFFSIGAMIGAMITMYSAVANRQKEIGTLRALGFSRSSILFSFLIESVLLAFFGGLLGATASMLMVFVQVPVLNFASWSEVVFTFTPTPQIIATALIFACGMGLLGGLFPAVRAMRVSPVPAMRE